MFVLTGGSTSPNIPSVMDEIVFNSSSSRLSIPPLFFAGRVLLREDGRQHRAPSSIYRRGCMPHHHFHLQFLYILRLGKLTRRGRPKVLMKIAHTHTNYKTILFYEAPAAHVELTPSKLNSGGVESDRDQNHLHFYKAFMDEVRCPMSHLHLDVRGNLWRFWWASAVNIKPSRPVEYLSTGVYAASSFFIFCHGSTLTH